MKHNTYKIELCLYAFLEVGTYGLHQIEISAQSTAYRFKYQPGEFWSSCLHSDVSVITKKGIKIERRIDPFKAPNRFRSNYKRFSLPNRAEAIKALKILNKYRVDREEEFLSCDVAAMLLTQFPEQRS
ncbi:MAG: hypothetical protein OXC48_07710 [Endozoicomonadaceae bacterium]|nr:hypothetical protein [Endozoicomonadaceae bacterium]